MSLLHNFGAIVNKWFKPHCFTMWGKSWQTFKVYKISELLSSVIYTNKMQLVKNGSMEPNGRKQPEAQFKLGQEP